MGIYPGEYAFVSVQCRFAAGQYDMSGNVSDNAIVRFGNYRRLLRQMRREGARYVYSHQLAEKVQVTPAQVRRDMMVIGQAGHPARGYQVEPLIDRIDHLLDAPGGQAVILAGAGNLGRALIAFFAAMESQSAFRIVAAFDTDPRKIGQSVSGKPCYDLDAISSIVRNQHVDVGIITVPAEAAQNVAERMVDAGIRSIMNFAPVRIELPAQIYIEYNDMSISLERAGYMARRRR